MGHQFDGMKQGQAGFWPPLIQQQQKKILTTPPGILNRFDSEKLIIICHIE
jgi:hypothetical protein